MKRRKIILHNRFYSTKSKNNRIKFFKKKKKMKRMM